MDDATIATQDLRPGDLPDGPVLSAFRLWDGLRRPGDPMPAAADLDLATVDRKLLPHLGLSTALLPDGRFKSLFQGSAVAVMSGRNAPGLYMDEVYPPHLYGPAKLFMEMVARDRVPLLARYTVAMDAERWVESTRIGLPFAGPDGAMQTLLMAFVYKPSDAARREGVRMLSPDARVHGGSFHRIRPDGI